MIANTQDLQYYPSKSHTWFMNLVKSTMLFGTSTRSGSVLSGDSPGKSRLDLNRQMVQTSDPQGIYITDSSGSPFGFTNDHGYDDIRDFLNIADTNVRSTGLKNVYVPDTALSDMFHVPIPADVTVFEVLERIPDVPTGCSLLNKSLGRDFAWIWMHEQKSICAALLANTKTTVPTGFAQRIGRFHLVDGVRGTPTLWGKSEVKHYEGSVSVVERSPAGLLAKIHCDFQMSTRDGRRRYRGKLDGLLLFDPSTQLLLDATCLAQGLHFGNGVYTPNAPKGEYRLLTRLLMSRGNTGRIVPPEKVATDGNIREYKHPA